LQAEKITFNTHNANTKLFSSFSLQHTFSSESIASTSSKSQAVDKRGKSEDRVRDYLHQRTDGFL
jgi:hypothetical protein